MIPPTTAMPLPLPMIPPGTATATATATICHCCCHDALPQPCMLQAHSVCAELWTSEFVLNRRVWRGSVLIRVFRLNHLIQSTAQTPLHSTAQRSTHSTAQPKRHSSQTPQCNIAQQPASASTSEAASTTSELGLDVDLCNLAKLAVDLLFAADIPSSLKH